MAITELPMHKSIAEILKDRSIPEFVKRDYPTFIAFISSYLEFMEQSKSPHDIAIHLKDYRDIDTTLDEFIEFFRKEYLVNIPNEVLADKRLLAKNIKNFYLNKGNEHSYRFLFRILYNDNIEFYYPKVDVLRASDGKWYEQRSIKITLSDPDNITLLNSKQIVGVTSGALATIESVLRYIDRGETIVELSLSEIRGDFIAEEFINIMYFDENGQPASFQEQIVEIFTGIDMIAGGSSYAIGDTISVRDNTGTELSKAKVIQVTKGPVTGLTIIDGGLNYNGEIKEVDRLYALPIGYTWNGVYLADAPIGAQDSNDYDFANAALDTIIDTVDIESEGDMIEVVDSSVSSGSGAFGIVNRVNSMGTITEVQLLAGGNLYQAPTAEVISSTGSGADIAVVGGGGSISKMKLENFPVIKDEDIDSNGFSVYPDFTSAGDANAVGVMESGALAVYPGRWLNEDGHLSSSKRLQDNFYYQDYSYVVKVGLDLSRWRDVVKKILHPAGLALFGEVSIITRIDTNNTILGAKVTRKITSVANSAPDHFQQSIIKLYEIDSNLNRTPILDSNGNHLIDY